MTDGDGLIFVKLPQWETFYIDAGCVGLVNICFRQVLAFSLRPNKFLVVPVESMSKGRGCSLKNRIKPVKETNLGVDQAYQMKDTNLNLETLTNLKPSAYNDNVIKGFYLWRNVKDIMSQLSKPSAQYNGMLFLNLKRYLDASKHWRSVLNTLGDTKIRTLHPWARRRASPPLKHEGLPGSGTCHLTNTSQGNMT